MIQTVNFTKKYGKKTAVDGVNLSAEKGCVTGLLGPNGAGKTTILKAICGLHYATSGTVFVQDIDVAENPVAVKEIVGYVSEQPALFGSYKVRDFLDYSAKIRLASSKKDKKFYAESVEKVTFLCNIQDVLDKKIRELSKGYRQRLSFAQALIHDPAVLVLDEPVSGLDPVQIHQMRSLIKNLAHSKTILLSTHLMQEVEALCQEVHIISKGKLVASGSVNQIAQASGCNTFEEAFLQLTAEDSQKER